MAKASVTVVQTPKGHPCIVTDTQKAMLDFIHEHPEALYSEIGEHVGFNVPTVTTYVSRMVKAGLVRRKDLKVDGRRRVGVTLCRGTRLYQTVLKAHQ